MLQRSFVSVLENKYNAFNSSFSKNPIKFKAVLHFKLLSWVDESNSFKLFIHIYSINHYTNLWGGIVIILILCMRKMRQKRNWFCQDLVDTAKCLNLNQETLASVYYLNHYSTADLWTTWRLRAPTPTPTQHIVKNPHITFEFPQNWTTNSPH